MNINVISTGKLGDSGCLSTFQKMWWKITKGALIIEKGYMTCVLYLCPHNTYYSMSVASTETSVALWHHRLGHMSEKGMQILHSMKLLPDLKHVSLEFYENCIYEKHKRVRFLRVGKLENEGKFRACAYRCMGIVLGTISCLFSFICCFYCWCN